MQLCCRIRLELSEQIIPAKGSQEPLPNGAAADKAAFCRLIRAAELLLPCERGCTACGICLPCLGHPAALPVPSHPPQFPAPKGKNQSSELLCEHSHLSARSTWMERKSLDQFFSLLAF